MASSRSGVRRKRKAALRRSEERFQRALRDATVIVNGKLRKVERAYDIKGASIGFEFSAGRIEAFLKRERLVLCTFSDCENADSEALSGQIVLGFDRVHLCPKAACVLTREVKFKV